MPAMLLPRYVVFQQLDLVDVSVRYDHICPLNTNTNPYADAVPCNVEIKIPRDMFPPVYMYYEVRRVTMECVYGIRA